mgnify:FL=1
MHICAIGLAYRRHLVVLKYGSGISRPRDLHGAAYGILGGFSGALGSMGSVDLDFSACKCSFGAGRQFGKSETDVRCANHSYPVLTELGLCTFECILRVCGLLLSDRFFRPTTPFFRSTGSPFGRRVTEEQQFLLFVVQKLL